MLGNASEEVVKSAAIVGYFKLLDYPAGAANSDTMLAAAYVDTNQKPMLLHFLLTSNQCLGVYHVLLSNVTSTNRATSRGNGIIPVYVTDNK